MNTLKLVRTGLAFSEAIAEETQTSADNLIVGTLQANEDMAVKFIDWVFNSRDDVMPMLAPDDPLAMHAAAAGISMAELLAFAWKFYRAYKALKG